ncbi:Hypothetical predicted protein [Cloeon dipterum]|uniref:Endonuclease/exonuclease/phosphatase domain-containing protein n=1 Tax=Cloeon dipterum TaxID=197152 RepID=A0A8S1E4S5_9INSE|nr:Hypothetical predicted protein [Cloeon dipterum]
MGLVRRGINLHAKSNSKLPLKQSGQRAPNSTPEQNIELLRSFSLATEVQQNYDACLVFGDFNLAIDWSADPPVPYATPADLFLNCFDDLAFAQLIKNATRTTDTSEKLIDLFLCDAPNLVSSAEVVSGVSDHDALHVHLDVDSRRPTPVLTTEPDWRRANWDLVNERLAENLLRVCTIDDLFTAWEAWKTTIFACIAEVGPSKRRRTKRRLLPWLDKSLKKK